MKLHPGTTAVLFEMGFSAVDAHVVYALLAFVRPDSTSVSVSERQLAAAAPAALRTVQRCIQKMKDRGLVVVRPGSRENHTAAMYDVQGFWQVMETTHNEMQQ